MSKVFFELPAVRFLHNSECFYCCAIVLLAFHQASSKGHTGSVATIERTIRNHADVFTLSFDERQRLAQSLQVKPPNIVLPFNRPVPALVKKAEYTLPVFSEPGNYAKAFVLLRSHHNQANLKLFDDSFTKERPFTNFFCCVSCKTKPWQFGPEAQADRLTAGTRNGFPPQRFKNPTEQAEFDTCFASANAELRQFFRALDLIPIRQTSYRPTVDFFKQTLMNYGPIITNVKMTVQLFADQLGRTYDNVGQHAVLVHGIDEEYIYFFDPSWGPNRALPREQFCNLVSRSPFALLVVDPIKSGDWKKPEQQRLPTITE